MAKGKPYRRLSLKLLAMLLLAAMAAIALGLTLQVLGDYLVERVYCSEKRQNLRLLEATEINFPGHHTGDCNQADNRA